MPSTIDRLQACQQGTTQDTVDAAVGLVDDWFKAGLFKELDEALGILADKNLSFEVYIALLVTSRIESERLPSRPKLEKAFVDKLHSEEATNPRAQVLLRWYKTSYLGLRPLPEK